MDFETEKFLVEIYAQLCLVLLGFVLPLISGLLSFLPQATRLLSEKYKNEIAQSEENLKNATEKIDGEGRLDDSSVEIAIKELRERKRSAEQKLRFLDPKATILTVSAWILASLVLIIVDLIPTIPPTVRVLILFGGAYSLWHGINSLWGLFCVLIEATEVNNQSQRDYESKNIELLSTLIEKVDAASDVFIDPQNVEITIAGQNVAKKPTYTYSVNKKHTLTVEVNNSDYRMIKNSELGVMFPKDCMVEKTSGLSSLYSGTDGQIARLNTEMIYADENRMLHDIVFTPLKQGKFDLTVFFKAENVKPVDYEMKLMVNE